MNIEQKILDYKSQLDYFDDVMDKYKLLLDQGKKASVFPEEYSQKSFLVIGCQANVWLFPKFDKGLMFFLLLERLISKPNSLIKFNSQ